MSRFHVLTGRRSGRTAGRCLVWALAAAAICVPRLLAEDSLPTIRAVEGLRFEPPRMAVEPGARLQLRFENADTTAQPHNCVVVRPGTRASVLAAALALGGEGPKREYVPESPDVLAATPVLAAGTSTTLTVTLPKEPGIYPIVCTFPGHGVIMFGALYAGVPMPERAEADDNIPRLPPPPPLDPDPRPMVRRLFLPDASPAAVAVALPQDWNLCWDAGPCRLRYGWFGEFLDAERHFEGKGQALAKLGGTVAWKAPGDFPVRFGDGLPAEVAFRGYRLIAGEPEFQYTIDGQLVQERFSVNGTSLVRTFRFPGTRRPVRIAVALDPLVLLPPDRGPLVDGVLRVQPAEAEEIALRYSVEPSSPNRPR